MVLSLLLRTVRMLAARYALLVLLLPSANVSAQDSDPLTRANELFSRGKEQQKAGDVAAACASFAESQELEARPGTLLNLGLCHEEQGFLLKALAELREAHRLASEADRQDRVELANSHILAIEGRLARVKIRASRGERPLDAKLWVDGEPTALTDDRQALVEPGPHTLEVEASGFRRIELQLALTPSSVTALTLLPVAAAIEPARVAAVAPSSESSVGSTPAPRDDSTWRALRTASWIVAAVGVGASLVLGAIALEQKSVLHKHCVGKVCDDTGTSAVATGRSLIVASDIAFAAGAAGAVSWLVLPGGWLNPASERAPTAKATARRMYW